VSCGPAKYVIEGKCVGSFTAARKPRRGTRVTPAGELAQVERGVMVANPSA